MQNEHSQFWIDCNWSEWSPLFLFPHGGLFKLQPERWDAKTFEHPPSPPSEPVLDGFQWAYDHIPCTLAAHGPTSFHVFNMSTAGAISYVLSGCNLFRTTPSIDGVLLLARRAQSQRFQEVWRSRLLPRLFERLHRQCTSQCTSVKKRPVSRSGQLVDSKVCRPAKQETSKPLHSALERLGLHQRKFISVQDRCYLFQPLQPTLRSVLDEDHAFIKPGQVKKWDPVLPSRCWMVDLSCPPSHTALPASRTRIQLTYLSERRLYQLPLLGSRQRKRCTMPSSPHSSWKEGRTDPEESATLPVAPTERLFKL